MNREEPTLWHEYLPLSRPGYFQFRFSDIKRIIEGLELYIIPCANPDGRKFSMQPPTATNKWWRKNRRPQVGVCNPVGVDINRNFPPGWDVETYFNSAAINDPHGAYEATTNDPCDPIKPDLYHGPSSASEAETKNIIHLINTKKIRFYLDVHSFQREIYFPWGINSNQTTDTSKSFLNSTLNRNAATGVGGRDLNKFNDPAKYREYFPIISALDLLADHRNVGNHMKNSIRLATGSDSHAINRSDYTVKQSLGLYVAPGASDDFAFSTQLQLSGNKAQIDNNLFPVYSFTMEAGHSSDGQFWPLPTPSQNQFRKVQREIHAAVIGVLRFAATWKMSAGVSGNDDDCFVVTAIYDSPDHETVEFLRHFRDVEMQHSDFSRKFVNIVNKYYYKVGPLLANYIRKRERVKLIARKTVIFPLTFIIRNCLRLSYRFESQKTRSILVTTMLLLLMIVTTFVSIVFLIYLVSYFN